MQVHQTFYSYTGLYSHVSGIQDVSQSQEEKGQDVAVTDEKKALNGENLSTSEMQLVRELESVDAQVRAHEAAHIAAGSGVVTGGASFSYTRGPDGKMYVTAGEVPISLKEGKTPDETIQNARQVQAAALAPADPSPQDYKVAASAAQMEAQARIEQTQEQVEELEKNLKKDNKAQNTDNKAHALQSYSKNLYVSYTPKFEIVG